MGSPLLLLRTYSGKLGQPRSGNNAFALLLFATKAAASADRSPFSGIAADAAHASGLARGGSPVLHQNFASGKAGEFNALWPMRKS
jgi:hypothetical protein